MFAKKKNVIIMQINKRSYNVLPVTVADLFDAYKNIT